MADWSSQSFAWPPFPPMEDGQQQQWPGDPNWPPFGESSSTNNYFGWPQGFGNRGGGGGLGAGTIILVAVLVTGFSLMTLLLLRLWFCGCSQDDDARRQRNWGNSSPPLVSKVVFGLRRDVIDSFQLVNYRALVAMSSGGDDQCCCPVCLIDFEEEDGKIRVLPGCGHGFHSECIDMWLFSHTSCPVCRRDLLPQGSSSARDQEVVIQIPATIPQERG